MLSLSLVVVVVTTACSGEAISTISKLDYRHSYVPHYDIAHRATLETSLPLTFENQNVSSTVQREYRNNNLLFLMSSK